MHFRHRQQVTTAGLAVFALALAACSSSSSSTTTSSWTSSASASSSSAPLSGTLNGSGSTFQTVYQQTAIQSFKSVQPGMTVNYGSGGSGKGRTDLSSGWPTTPVGLADPRHRVGELRGQDRAVLPRLPRPDHHLVQPVRRQQPEAGCDGPRGDLPGKITSWNNSAITALNPGVSLPSTPITVAVRSDSSGTTQNFSLYLRMPAGARGRSAAARPSSGPPPPGPATATPGWRRSSSPPPGPSATWTTPTPRPPD